MIPRTKLSISYHAYRRVMEPCDVALWEPHSTTLLVRLGEEAIAKYTDGPYCHASCVGYNGQRIWQYGYQFWNGYGSPLSGEVKRNSGGIAIYRAVTPYDKNVVMSHMIGDLAGHYDFTDLGLIGLSALVGYGVLSRFRGYREAVLRRSRETSNSICSQHVARSFGYAGVKFRLDDEYGLVSPNDLARPTFMKYIGHLTWTAGDGL